MNSEQPKQRYALNFDLRIEDLKKHFSKTHPKGAYTVLEKYMTQNGFSHRQYSGYISNDLLSRTELLQFVYDLHDHFKWLIKCETKMDATVIVDIFDIKQLIIDSTSSGTDDDDISI